MTHAAELRVERAVGTAGSSSGPLADVGYGVDGEFSTQRVFGLCRSDVRRVFVVGARADGACVRQAEPGEVLAVGSRYRRGTRNVNGAATRERPGPTHDVR